MSLSSAVDILMNTMNDLGLTKLEKGRVLTELSAINSFSVLSDQAALVLEKAKANLEAAGLVAADDDGV